MRQYVVNEMRMTPSKLYVASSWRNEYQPAVVELMRELGHEVYDFRNPPQASGFAWSDVDPNWEKWTTPQYRECLFHPIAVKGFNNDFAGMRWADICLLVLPCGRSAHAEAGWMAGAGKPVFVYSPVAQEPELMYRLFDFIIAGEGELRRFFFCTD